MLNNLSNWKNDHGKPKQHVKVVLKGCQVSYLQCVHTVLLILSLWGKMLVQTFRAKLTQHIISPNLIRCAWSSVTVLFVMSLLFCWSVLANLFQGRVILSNKMARTVAFFYTLMLHCLVFLVSHMTLGLHRPALLMLHCCFMCVCVCERSGAV